MSYKYPNEFPLPALNFDTNKKTKNDFSPVKYNSDTNVLTLDNDNAMKLIEKLVEKGLRYLKRPIFCQLSKKRPMSNTNGLVNDPVDINDKNVFVRFFTGGGGAP